MIVAGSVLAVPEKNVDTDQIFPGKYLTLLSREGFGNMLFEGMQGGRELLATKPDAKILVAGDNFGCGSSREHAVWAMTDFGFKAVVAPSLARIFHENAYNNALVPAIVEDPQEYEACVKADSLEIDVVNEVIKQNGEQIARFKARPAQERVSLTRRVHGVSVDQGRHRPRMAAQARDCRALAAREPCPIQLETIEEQAPDAKAGEREPCRECGYPAKYPADGIGAE